MRSSFWVVEAKLEKCLIHWVTIQRIWKPTDHVLNNFFDISLFYFWLSNPSFYPSLIRNKLQKCRNGTIIQRSSRTMSTRPCCANWNKISTRNMKRIFSRQRHHSKTTRWSVLLEKVHLEQLFVITYVFHAFWSIHFLRSTTDCFQVLYKNKEANEYVVFKILLKSYIVQKNQVKQTIHERKVLHAIQHPFMIEMLRSFKDNDAVYFVMPFVNGGDMNTYLNRWI